MWWFRGGKWRLSVIREGRVERIDGWGGVDLGGWSWVRLGGESGVILCGWCWVGLSGWGGVCLSERVEIILRCVWLDGLGRKRLRIEFLGGRILLSGILVGKLRLVGGKLGLCVGKWRLGVGKL